MHGLASNARLWDGVADRLSALGHAVAAVDQRGHGRSDKPERGYDLATLSFDLVSVLEALGYERPVVAGQSWGANVVLELSARRPNLVRGVACVDGGVVDLARHLPDWESCLAELGPPGPPVISFDQLEADLRAAHPDWPQEGIAGALACYHLGPGGTAVPRLSTERHLTILRGLWHHRPSALFGELRVPALLLMCEAGEGWQLDAKRKAVAEVQRSGARVRTNWFEADHDVHAECPGEVAALMHAAAEDGFFT